MYRLGIKNGLVYIDGRFQKTNLYIDGETIANISPEAFDCEEEIDAANYHVLPGFIDPHVHFSLGVGESVSKDNFADGSKEAALGGVTTYMDFLDPVKESGEIAAEFAKRTALTAGTVVDYAFHTTIANPIDTPESIFEESLKVGINSVKLFTTYADTDRRTYEPYIYQLLKASKAYGGRVIVHAEKDSLIHKSKKILVKDHADARPVACEYDEVMELAKMAKETQGNLYIVHTNCGSTAVAIKHEYGGELAHGRILLESCPHYFLLNAEALGRPDGYKYTMTPPLRPENERRLLVQNVDAISTIGTDHCPYLKEQKKHRYTSEIPMGIGGIRYSFLNMYQLFGYEIVEKYTSGPAMVYGLEQKGSIAVGMDADVVLFNENGRTTVDDEMSVYDQTTYKGSIDLVLSRGQVVNDHGVIVPHEGKYVARKQIG